jgi:hypothetical protein
MDISLMGYKLNLEILILIGIVYLILMVHMLASCCNCGAIIETFVGAPYSLNNNSHVNTKSWFQQNLIVSPGKPISDAVNKMVNRKNQALPLPEGQLDLFANMPFKPECCPNAYSNSSGCACMNTNTYNYLITRGGNNVPYSEF